MYYISVACAHQREMAEVDPYAIVQELKREVADWCPQYVLVIIL